MDGTNVRFTHCNFTFWTVYQRSTQNILGFLNHVLKSLNISYIHSIIIVIHLFILIFSLPTSVICHALDNDCDKLSGFKTFTFNGIKF